MDWVVLRYWKGGLKITSQMLNDLYCQNKSQRPSVCKHGCWANSTRPQETKFLVMYPIDVKQLWAKSVFSTLAVGGHLEMNDWKEVNAVHLTIYSGNPSKTID